MRNPTAGLDEVIHQRARLGIMTVLASVARADFGSLKTILELTDGNLSRHLAALEQAGYITIDKTYEGKRPKTYTTATTAGRRAYKAELSALRRLLGETPAE